MSTIFSNSGNGGGSPASTYPEKPADAAQQISDLIARRWSPRAFDEGRPVGREQILALLEAARWAPSCFNEQPWRYLVFDGGDPEALRAARACLIGFNAWALKAPVLLLSLAKNTFAGNGKPNRHAQHDLGLASANFVLEAVRQGLVVHQMGGFDAEKARRDFGIPSDYTPMAMMAVGYPYTGRLEELPGALRSMETEPRRRKPVGEVAFAGRWSAPFGR
jgi:nitroreductase